MEMMGWCLVFAMILWGRNALCDLSLNVPHEVQGVRGDSVVIPCTYTPSEQYEELQVDWYFRAQAIYHRYQSEVHPLTTDYRGRLGVPDSIPGDVSLTLQKLHILDRGNYKCKVTWTTKDGNTIFREGISRLIVLRVRPPTVKPPVIIKDREFDNTKREPVTTEPVVEVITEGHPVTTEPVEEVNTEGIHFPRKSDGKPIATKLFDSEQGTTLDTSFPKALKTSTTENSKTTNQITKIKKHPSETTLSTYTTGSTCNPPGFGAAVTGTTLDTSFSKDLKTSTTESSKTTNQINKIKKHPSETTLSTYTTGSTRTPPGFGAIVTGHGVPLYVLLLIGLVCAISILALIIALSNTRKKNMGTYNFHTMNQEAERLEAETSRTVNQYETRNQPTVSEYEPPTSNNEYETLIPGRVSPSAPSPYEKPEVNHNVPLTPSKQLLPYSDSEAFPPPNQETFTSFS